MNFREKIKKEEAVLGAYNMGGKIAVAFLVEVVYKNGVVREFWCSDFKKKNKGHILGCQFLLVIVLSI